MKKKSKKYESDFFSYAKKVMRDEKYSKALKQGLAKAKKLITLSDSERDRFVESLFTTPKRNKAFKKAKAKFNVKKVRDTF